ncbi:GNAT family N-acetyltransferase [Paenibacillus phytohabitans]|uniref:GNAT family N-acetyltransferase n=1 Tax=Paenibacillus phytohabitans TaxID=2654978 RepID=UPI003009D667
MIELKFENYPAAEVFFADKKQHIPALSVLQGNYPGRVFADDAAAPSLAVVWATGRWMYAAGDIRTELSRMKLTAFLQTQVIPDCRRRQKNWFEIYTDDCDAWTALFKPGYAGLQVYRHMESVYEFNRARFNPPESKVTEDASGSGVTVDYRQFPVLEEHEDDMSDIHNRFSSLTTTGAVVKVEGQAVSVCKHNGFTDNNRYFIDVDTYSEAERGKGYATLAARSLISYYLDRGQLPLWETTHENTASHRLALKLGFEPVESYPVFAFVMESQELKLQSPG